MSEHYLYTYLPKDNTADKDGILSTYASRGKLSRADMKSDRGWTKYITRAVRDGYPATFRGVCDWLDATIPGLRRSRSISFLTEPIGNTDRDSLKKFRDSSRLYRVDPARLLALGIATKVAEPNLAAPGGCVLGDSTDTVDFSPVDWKVGNKGRFGFSGVPHYFLETRDGSIPAEYVEEVTPEQVRLEAARAFMEDTTDNDLQGSF